MHFRHAPVFPLLVLGSFVQSGCGPGTEHVDDFAATVIVGPEYTTHGIRVPDDTRRSLGLKVVEIGEEKITATVDLTLRVYRTAPDVARASALVSSEQAVLLQPGQPLELTTRGGATAVGSIISLRDDLKDVTGEVEVLAEIANAASLPIGSFISARVIVRGGEVVTSVPRSALIEGVEGPFVYTVSGDRFVRTPVTVGAIMDGIAEIKEGLYSGDEVVAEPAMSLWLTELAAIKGGHACCAVPAKGR